ncbi:TolC family protein [Candidatus Sumerlaeota bacterium]|nr:TolC family protein [Candidatus Sumerlaeota bacterium]
MIVSLRLNFLLIPASALLILTAKPCAAQERAVAELENGVIAESPLFPAESQSADNLTSGLDFLQEFGPPEPITPGSLLGRALEKNLQLQVTSLEAAQSADSAQAAKGIYDLTLLFSAEQYKDTIQSTKDPDLVEDAARLTNDPITLMALQDYSSVRIDQRQAAIGLQQFTPTGATLAVDTASVRYKQGQYNAGYYYDPLFSRTYSITVTQPLLKNFGPFVSNAPINIARKQYEIAQRSFEYQLQVLASEAARAYWDLVFAIGNAEVNRVSLEQARGLSNDQRKKFEEGVVDKVTVLQAEAGVAAREGQYLTARQNIRMIQDVIKKLMDVDGGAWDSNLVPVDLAPTIREYNVALDQALDNALNKRPDYRQLLLAQELLEINERFARNQKLPQINLFGSYGLRGTDDDYSDAERYAETQDYDNWTIGVQVMHPLQNRAARYQYAKAQKDVEQGQLEIQNLRNTIIQQLRDSRRAIETNRQLIAFAETSIQAEQAKLDAEIKRFREGLSTSQDLLDFQEDLQIARTEYLRSVVTYNKAVIDLELSQGTLLETLGVKIDYADPFAQE